MRQLLSLLALLVAPTFAHASVNSMTVDGLINGVLSTFIYGFIGIVMAVIGYKVVDLLTPGNLSEDIAEGQNIALSLFASATVLGICIIIAAVLVG